MSPPALARQIVGYVVGKVYARRGLSRPRRHVVTIATLTALRDGEPQLEQRRGVRIR